MSVIKQKLFYTIIVLSCFFMGLMVHYNRMDISTNQDLNDLLNSQIIRKNILKSVCDQGNFSETLKSFDGSVANRLFVEPNYKFLYCEMPKVGCTNWKRVLLLLKLNFTIKAEHIEHEAIHSSNLLKRLSDYSPPEQKMMLNNYTKVIFTRDPFERIVSAYRDKFLHSGDYYGSHIANIIKSLFRKGKMKKSDKPVTFEEFVRFILQQSPRSLDIHWKPMHLLCDPCNIKYNVLGKFQTLQRDSDYVLKLIGAPSNLKYPDIKQYNESRTTTGTTAQYISALPLQLVEGLMDLYRLDFMLFDYLQ